MRPNSSASQAGFTLLELALVLAILGVLTMLAVREIGQVQDQQRFEASQRTLEAVRDAVWGAADDRAPDGSGVRAGFVADVGRLPERLDELWTNATGMLDFALRPGDGDAEVRVPGGWRGPYVRLPWNATNLLDGWGNACVCTNQAPDVWRVAPGPESGTNAGLFVEFNENEVAAWVWGQVEVDTNLLASGACTVRIRVFGPDGGCTEASGLAIDLATNVVAWSIAAPTPVGLRAVRAYLEGAATNRSAIRYVSLRSGTNGPVSLEIRR